jgi:hypothetical protein
VTEKQAEQLLALLADILSEVKRLRDDVRARQPLA